MDRDSSTNFIKLEPEDTITSQNDANQDFQDYLTDSLNPHKRQESYPGLPSNNSSQTFFERSNPGSPLLSKSISQPLLNTDCMPQYVSDSHPYDFPSTDTTQTQQHPYHVSPFNFHYDGSQEDYLRYRSGNYTNNAFDLSYMQQLTRLSSHWDELNPQHCNIPIGKRRPRPIMISGENTEKLRKMYEPPLGEEYAGQSEGKDVYDMPIGVTPGRYYYSNVFTALIY